MGDQVPQERHYREEGLREGVWGGQAQGAPTRWTS